VAPEVLIAVAIAFALVTGANDGGALIAPGLRVPGLSVTVSLMMLTGAVVAYPLLISTAVARTMLSSIVPADADGATALAVGFLAAVGVVTGLAWLRLTTSMTFAVNGGYDACIRLVDSVELFSHVANLGDTRSLIIHSASTTHRQLTEEQQKAAGADPDVVRLSIGIEDPDDLIRDLDQALAKATG
jgi:hypothetical protein